MSLSERLRAAEQQRMGKASPEQDGDASDSTIDLTTGGAAVIDLTARRQQSGGSGRSPGDPLQPYQFDPEPGTTVWAAGAEGISYNPVRDGASAFGDPSPQMADRSSTTPCPRCGGVTQVDLFDQVHQTTSLSCVSCFHMFRVHA